jgi:hypothetical protein
MTIHVHTYTQHTVPVPVLHYLQRNGTHICRGTKNYVGMQHITSKVHKTVQQHTHYMYALAYITKYMYVNSQVHAGWQTGWVAAVSYSTGCPSHRAYLL